MEEKICDPLEMANQLVDMMRPDAARKGLGLRLQTGELPPRLYCCPDRIRQILVNLLGNALKFTATGEIVLEIGRAEEPDGAKLRLAVRDTGIGIPPDKPASSSTASPRSTRPPTANTAGGVELAISKNSRK